MSDSFIHSLPHPEEKQKSFHDTTLAMRWSFWVGILMLLMKVGAYVITASVAILSDAAESVVHLLAVAFAAYSLWLSHKPPDETHPYGYDRISFFSAGFEGAMIVIAAFYIIYEATLRWIQGLAVQQLEIGTVFVAAATIINGFLGWFLVRKGKKHNSLILEANGRHVLTDSWTSFGVVLGLLLTLWTGWLPFDPIVAILVAFNILWSGGQLMKRSVSGLMDRIDPDIENALRQILDKETKAAHIQYHKLRFRNAGSRYWVEFHLLFDDSLPLAKAHAIATQIEVLVGRSLPADSEVISHLEPLQGHNEAHVAGEKG